MPGFDAYFCVTEAYSGWGSVDGKTLKKYLDVESDGLNLNQQIRERDARMANEREVYSNWVTNERLSPAGDISFQPRPDDLMIFAMAHFQAGTWLMDGSAAGIGTGTAIYAPVDNSPDWVGSTWSILDVSGPYAFTVNDIYPLKFFKQVGELADRTTYGNWFVFTSGIVDVLRFEQAFDSDLLVTPSIKFYGAQSAKGSYAWNAAMPSPPDASGSYSELPGLVDWQGTLSLWGANAGAVGWDIDRFMFSGNNRTTDRGRLGYKGYSKHPLQKYLAEGEFDLAVDSLKPFYFAGAGSSAVIKMRWQYDTKNWVEIEMPKVVLRPSEMNIPGGDVDNTMTWNYRAVGQSGTPSVILRVASNKLATAAYSPSSYTAGQDA